MQSANNTHLSVTDAAVVVVGIVFGSGIFVAPQIIAGFCNSFWLSLLAWPLGALIAISGSLCYAECIARTRAQGGFYSVFRHTFGEAFATTAGLVSQVVISPAALAGPVTIGGQALSMLVWGHEGHKLLCTLTLLGTAALLNVQNIHFSSAAQRLFVIAKVSLVLSLLIACLWGRAAQPDVQLAQQAAHPLSVSLVDWTLLAPFFGVLLWTFDGWTDVTMISSSLRQPGRDLFRALTLGLLGLAVIFVAVQAAVMRILGVAGTAHSTQPLAEGISMVFGSTSLLWVQAAIVLSTFTSAHGVMWMVASLTRVMSRSRALPGALLATDEKLKRPIGSVGFVALLSSLACLLDSFTTIVALFSFFIWVLYGLMTVALWRLRQRERRPQGVWLAPGGMAPPLLIGIVALLMTVSHVATYPRACALGTLGFVALYGLQILRTGMRSMDHDAEGSAGIQ